MSFSSWVCCGLVVPLALAMASVLVLSMVSAWAFDLSHFSAKMLCRHLKVNGQYLMVSIDCEFKSDY